MVKQAGPHATEKVYGYCDSSLKCKSGAGSGHVFPEAAYRTSQGHGQANQHDSKGGFPKEFQPGQEQVQAQQFFHQNGIFLNAAQQ